MEPDIKRIKRKLKRTLKRTGAIPVAYDHIGLAYPEIFESGPIVDMTKEQITRYFGCPTCGAYAGEPCVTTDHDYTKLINTRAPWAKLVESYGATVGGERPKLHNERHLLAAA